jgi:phage tail sheath protein FI
MPEYMTPGVYVEEIERGPRPIEGVPTSIAAFLGETERGPIRPRLVTSYNDFKRHFGGIFRRGYYMPYAVNGFFENGGRRLYVCRLVGEDATVATRAFGAFVLRAVGAGLWGNRIYARIVPGTTKNAANIAIGFRLQVAYWSTTPDGFAPFDPFDSDNRAVLPRPSVVEDYDDLSIDEASPDFYEKRLGTRLDASSALVLLDGSAAQPGEPPDEGDWDLLQGGTDDQPADVTEFIGDKQGQRDMEQGLAALDLDAYRDVSLVHAPFPQGDIAAIYKAIDSHCEKNRFRFAVLDSPSNQSNPGSVNPRNTLGIDSTYSAFYYPWVIVADPQTGARVTVPPGGYALGVYARTDAERGVFKAPANETARGVIDLEYEINDFQQGVLNPRGVNVLRKFPGRGIRVWGARTLTSNALWKYVSVRRLFIFLERSIYEGTQWVVFEPNSDTLWARVKDTLRLFLRGQWRQGALFGRTEDEAFFITCDRTTMSQDDILNGRLICEIGIAPVRPAEFVIFRIFQNTAEAQR